jgi:hypothetical protein
MKEIVEIEWLSGIEKYSFQAISFTGYQSKPYLLRQPEVTRSIGQEGIENNTTEIELADHDGYFSMKMLSSDQYLIGRKVRYWVEDQIVFTGLVSEFPKIENNTFKLRVDTFTLLQAPINFPITQDKCPSCPSQNLGKYGNMIVGDSQNLALFTAYRVGTNTFLAAWNPLSTITRALNKDNLDILTQITYSTDASTGYTYIYYNSSDDFVKFCATGPKLSNTIISNPAEMLQKFIELSRINITIANLTTATAIYTGRSWKGMIFCSENTTLQEVIENFQLSFGCIVAITRDGNILLKLLSFGNIGTTPKIITSQIKNFQKWRDTSLLKKAWTRKYLFCDNQYLMSPQDVLSAVSWTNDTGEFTQKYIFSEPVSWDVAQRMAYFRKMPFLKYGMEIPNNGVELGDEYSFSHPENYFPDQERIIQIQRIEKKKDSGFIKIEALDITDKFMTSTFILKDVNDPSAIKLYEPDNQQNPMLLWNN